MSDTQAVTQTEPGTPPVVEVVAQNRNTATLSKKQSLSTLVVLAGMVDLTARVSEKIVGGEIASSFAGASLNKGMIAQLPQSVAQKVIAKTLGD